MTTTTAVPSSDVSDFLFNVQKLDEIANGSALTYTDRFGQQRSTAAGVMARFAALNPRGAWATATLYQPRDLVLNSGTWYIALDTHTSGATFAGDLSAHWRPEQGVTRADLNSVTSGNGAEAVYFKQSDVTAAVRELMSRGRDTVSVFDFMSAAQIASVRAGDLVEDVTAACQACFTACKAQRTPWFPSGIYKTSAALVAYGGWHGAGAGAIFMPQGNHACFHFLPGTQNESWASSSIQAAFVGGFTIKFSGDSDTAGNVAHKGIWINKGTASASDGSCDNVTFGNIYFINPYNAFYQEAADKGNLWNCAFRDIMVIRPKEYGIYLDMTGSNGSLNVTFDNVCVDYNLAASYAKGALIHGIANLSFKGILTSRLTSDAAILSLSGCTNVVFTMQQENNNMIVSGQRPTMIVDCKSVEMALVVNTSTVNPGAGNIVNYIYVEDQTNSFVLRQFQVVGETIISGSRKVINAQLGAGSNTKFTILDGTVTSSDVVMSAAQLAATFFPATNYALQNNPATLRRHVARVDTTAGVATSLFSTAAYGGRVGKPAGLYVVYGTQNSDAAIGFTDLILVTGILGAQSVVVVSTNNIGGANARTYSIASDTLKVSIPTNIYRVSLAGFDGAGTWDTA